MSALTMMLAGGISLIAGLANVAALGFGQLNAGGTSRAIPWLQRSTSLMLAVVAWLFYLLAAASDSVAIFALWIAIGMSLSFVADLIMAEIIRLPNRVIGGIAVFALAHLSYLAAMFYLNGAGRVAAERWMLLWAIVFVLVALVYWRLMVYTPEAPRALLVGSLIYLVVIGLMVGGAWGLATANRKLWILAGGALLFFISDAILGNQIFRRNNWPYVGDVVWISYILGQAGIVWSVYAAELP